MLNAGLTLKNLKVKDFNGTWLMIKTADDYCQPEFIEFKNDQIIHFDLEQEKENELLKKERDWKEKLSESKYEFVNNNRIRIYRMGETLRIISDTKSITEDTEFATDYEKIIPTKTELTTQQIEKLEFRAQWNDEKIQIVFNKILDSPIIKKINKQLKREGQKLVLEKLQGTYFASIYYNGKRSTLIGIKEIDKEKAILFGFPETPFEVIAV